MTCCSDVGDAHSSDEAAIRRPEIIHAQRTRDIAKLIEPGRVHRRVYADPDVFELEMERMFGRAWLFVGHTSQVPKPGDYITTELGRQPVIMARHSDGNVQVLLNRCTHRGAKVVNERQGHAQRLVCCYHGWSYDTDGRLVERAGAGRLRRRFRQGGVRPRARAARRRISRLRVREPRRRRARASRTISAR